MDKNSYDVRLKAWMEMIKAANASNLRRQDWCEQNNVSLRSFYYWQRKVRDHILENDPAGAGSRSTLPAVSRAAAPAPVFCEITGPEQEMNQEPVCRSGFAAEAVLRCGSLSVMINSHTSDELLSRLVSVMRHA